MIVHEPYGRLPDGTMLERTYSDEGRYIQKVGTSEVYEAAIDIVPSQYAYTETDSFINADEELSDAEALEIIMGGAEA